MPNRLQMPLARDRQAQPVRPEKAGPSEAELEHLRTVIHALNLDLSPEFAPNRRGRPRKNRPAVVRSLVAMAVLAAPSAAVFVERLKMDPELNRLCGWTNLAEVPSISSFYRLIPQLIPALPDALRRNITPHFSRCKSLLLDTDDEQTAAPPPVAASPDPLLSLHKPLVRTFQSAGNDLSVRQLRALLACYLSGPPPTMRTLAAQLQPLEPDLGQTLQKLENLGLIKSAFDKHNRRRFRINRTRRGALLLRELFLATIDRQDKANAETNKPDAGISDLLPSIVIGAWW